MYDDNLVSRARCLLLDDYRMFSPPESWTAYLCNNLPAMVRYLLENS